MPRNKHTLTASQWKHLGSIIGDFLWDQERAHELVREYFNEQGIPEDRIAELSNELFRRIEAGFKQPNK